MKLTNMFKEKRWDIFLSSVFFVLGFSLIFSLVGVLLQSILSNVAYTVQLWLGRIGGVIIILFGLFLLGLITPRFLQKEYKFTIKKQFKSYYLTSFVFGAAFAVGWTPCVSAALGAILALAATNASSAFILLLAYTLGLGLPFLLVGLFTNQAQSIINKAGVWFNYFQKFFGFILIIIGILIFTSQLNRVANLEFVVNLLIKLNLGLNTGGSINSLNLINLFISFSAGLISFLSPCILPLIPGFLSYLASSAVKENEE